MTTRSDRMQRQAPVWLLTAFFVLSAASCEGLLNQSGSSNNLDTPGTQTPVNPDPNNPDPNNPDPLEPVDPTNPDAGPPSAAALQAMAMSFFPSQTTTLTPPRLYRLTQEQLRFALEGLFAVTLTESQIGELGRDTEALGFTNNASALDLQTSNSSSMYELFRTLAKAQTTQLPALAACLGQVAPPDTCVRNFIKNFGKKVFRAPVNKAQEDRLAALYTSVKAGGATVAVSIQFVIEAMLRSPSFLFREEVGTVGTGARTLSAQELASSLSAALTRKAPDAELSTKATDGTLTSPAELSAQARRLLNTQATNLTLVEFFKEWLRIKNLSEVEKDETLFPMFDTAMKAAMTEETANLIVGELNKPAASLRELMTTSKSFLKQPLEKVYKVTGLTTTAVETQLDPTQRAGLLTQPSLMASMSDLADSHPIRRGLFVLTRALCQSTPSLPRNVNVSLPDILPGETKRQRFTRHSTDESCRACHKSIDPFGFGLENLDAIGAYRATEQGTNIDASAVVEFLPFSKSNTTTAADLGRFLAVAPEFHSCFVRQMFRYTMGRQETEGDDPLLRAAYLQFANSEYNIKELQHFFVTSPTFTQRAL